MAQTLAPSFAADSSAQTADVDDTGSFSLDAGVGRNALLAVLGLTVFVVWSYWNMFQVTSVFWDQPQYSHGWIIPIIALFIMWSRRPNQEIFSNYASSGRSASGTAAQFEKYVRPVVGCCLAIAGYAKFGGVESIQWLSGVFLTLACLVILVYCFLGQPFARMQQAVTVDRWIGLAMIIAAMGVRFYATRISMDPLDRYSFLLAMLGVFTMVGGIRLLKWAGPAAAFLFFMFPLPSRVEQYILPQLQKIAAGLSEVVLTIIGVQAIRKGSQIEVEGIPMEVAEACSGLSMSTILIAMAIAMVLLIKRPWWDKFAILLTALPIALIANVFRIVATGLIWIAMDRFLTIDSEMVSYYRDEVHTWAGLVLMMPFALGLLWLEFKVLSMLTVEEEGYETHGAGIVGTAPPAAAR